MAYNFSPSGIQKLNAEDITKALNSGIFITATVKKQLRDRLSYLGEEESRSKIDQAYFSTKLSSSSPTPSLLSPKKDLRSIKISNSNDNIPPKNNLSRRIVMSDFANTIQQNTEIKIEPKIEPKNKQKKREKKRESISQNSIPALNEWDISSLDPSSLMLINPAIREIKLDAVVWGQSGASLEKIRAGKSKSQPIIVIPKEIEYKCVKSHSVDQIAIDVQDLTQSLKKVLNFKKIIDSTIINDINHDYNSNKLFDDGDLVIDYSEIEKIYKVFAIDRIHMNFLNLDRQIEILNRTDLAVKNAFHYGNIYIQKEIMRYCSYSYIEINKIIALSATCSNLLRNMSEFDKARLINSTKLVSVDRINELRLAFLAIQYSPDPIFKHFIEIIGAIKKLFKEFMSVTDTIIIKITQLENIINELSELKTYITDNFDPQIECDYYIEFKRQINGNIVPKGISSYAYHTFGNITMKQYDQEEYYGDLNETRVQYLFDQKYRSGTSNIIYICPSGDSDMKKMHISFTIADDIPFAKGGITINNTPIDVRTLTSLIVNPKFTSSVQEEIPVILVADYIDKWFKKQLPNKLSMSIDSEYDCQSFDSMATGDQDIFYSDAVFDQLIDADIYNDIIRPDMRDSFRKLVYKTS